MNGLLLALLLVQANPQNTGAVTGVVRGANGMPAPGVRVYAMAVRDTAQPANAGTALESQAQTDASGRYRLEVPAGRYHIASGSVDAPTYYPGTTNLAEARVISVTAGGLVADIHFSSFVPPARNAAGIGIVSSIPPLPAGSTGVLQGVLRYPDGAPAAGMAVLAIPTAAIAGAPGVGGGVLSAIYTTTLRGAVGTLTSTITRRVMNGYNIIGGRTDATGLYRLENVPPETYYIATGFADNPVFFPGTADILAAKTVVTVPTTRLDTLDFTVPLQPAVVSVSGRVTALGAAPAAGASVQLQGGTLPLSNFLQYGLPSRILNTTAVVKPDGTFEITSVLPGAYSVVASASGIRTNTVNITVADQPVRGLDFVIPVAALSGRILLEDGSPLPNPQVFTDAIVTTVNDPNIIGTTIMPISSDGKFGRIVEADEYRFYLRSLPDEYVVKSMTSGTQDLLKETLKLTSTSSTNIEIRVAARTGPLANEIKVSGTVIDGITGVPASAERVTLCCLKSGATERFSTPLRPDGAFEFAGVPRGRYTVELQTRAGQPRLPVINSDVEVTSEPISELTVLSNAQFGQFIATVAYEGGNPFPVNAPPIVVFAAATGRVRVTAQRNTDTYVASVPAGDRYNISVANLPEGYAIKSIVGSTTVPAAPPLGFGAPALPPLLPGPIVITIGPTTTR